MRGAMIGLRPMRGMIWGMIFATACRTTPPPVAAPASPLEDPAPAAAEAPPAAEAAPVAETSPAVSTRPAAEARTWWCVTISSNNHEVGGCIATEDRCARVRARFLGPGKTADPRVSRCTPLREVACFDAQGIRGPRSVCHPTIAICREHRVHFYSDCEQATGDCQMSSSGPTHPGD